MLICCTPGVSPVSAQVVERQPAGCRQSQGDADHQQRQQRIERRCRQATQCVAHGGQVLGQPGGHGTAPSAAGTQRLAHLALVEAQNARPQPGQ
jgi:hypothetical protein